MFEIGRIYHRQKDLHDIYGGNRQSGISSCANHPIIFLFTSPEGSQHGYFDRWESDQIFVYTGEGQFGDMELVRGNKAIQNHLQMRKQLHLFKKINRTEYIYEGEFEYVKHEFVFRSDTENRSRKTIEFYLIRL